MKFAPILFAILMYSGSMAQHIADQQAAPAPDQTVEEKLVRLAWENHPGQDIYQTRLHIAEKNATLAKWSWARNIRAVYNINDNTLGSDPNTNDPNVSGRMLAYPRYNIGLGISLGDILATPASIKIAKDEAHISEQEMNAGKIQLRAEVLERYYNYLMASQLLQIKSEEHEEAYTHFMLVSEKFKNGEASLDEYNKISGIYNNSRANLIQQETQLKIEKARLESYIGVKLETVLK